MELRQKIDLGGYKPTDANQGPAENEGLRLLEAVSQGRIDSAEARSAYRETLKCVLQDVERLLNSVDGKCVVSADHGEMFGEDPYPFIGRLYEHFNHPRTLALCKVPWLVVENNERREIVPEPPLTSEDAGPAVENQLKALGYR
jgi:hypothetical protein